MFPNMYWVTKIRHSGGQQCEMVSDATEQVIWGYSQEKNEKV